MEPIANDTAPIRVLLVEDEWLISEWVADSLSGQGFFVHAVADAAEALRHLALAPVDVLFTDINLPGGMDGATLARRARELVPGIAVLYASARPGGLNPQAQVSGSIFVPKPYEPALVGRLLAHAVTKPAAKRMPA